MGFVNFSPAWEPPEAQAAPAGDADSSPVQSVWTRLPFVLMLPKPEFPSTFSANVTRSGAVQLSLKADDLRLGVRFRAMPPVMGTTWTSPPVEPSSLINPSMNATFLPSGETRGTAICSFGL